MTSPANMPTERLSDERLREILAATEGVTPGPWEAGIKEHPWALPARELLGQHFPAATGTHKERWVNTAWDHPQAKAPVSVVGGSIGVGVDAPVHMVHIEEADARHIANCDPQTIAAILTEVLAAREALARIIAANDDYLRHNPHIVDPDPLTLACTAARELLPAFKETTNAA